MPTIANNTTISLSDNVSQHKTTEQTPQLSIKQVVADCAKAILGEHQSQVNGRIYQIVLSIMESALFLATLDETRGNQTKAANILGLSRNTFRTKLKTLGIDKHTRADSYKATNPIEKTLNPLYDCILYHVRHYFLTMQSQTINNLYYMVLAEIEEPLLKVVMPYNQNNQTRTAKAMGLSRGTVSKKLNIYGIEHG